MNSLNLNRKSWLFKLGAIALALFLVAFLVIFAFKVTGRSLGVRGRFSALKNTIMAVLDSRSVASSGQNQYTEIIFLHHSVGHNLIEQGGVREAFSKAGFNFWDHDYNWLGVTNPSGQPAGYSYNVPEDNTDVNGLARIFAQQVYPLPLNTLSGLLEHDVIIVKSCYPNSNINGEVQLAQDKTYYMGMRTTMDKYPDKIFIILTSPPLNPSETNPENAARARLIATWLNSDEFLSGHPNIFTYDLYSLLAGDEPAASDYNMLREEYQNGTDSHPNQMANETIGPQFVQFVIQTIRSYQSE